MRTYIVEWEDGESRPFTAPTKAQALALARGARPGVRIVEVD